jgi:Transcriptional regulatory protein, C terminal
MLVIISKDEDFAGVLAEHAKRELALEVQIFDAAEKAKSVESQLIIANETLPGKFLAPVLIVDQKPMRLQDVLQKIQNQLTKEEFPLAGGVLFSVQQKTITHGKKNISLTDKETQLLLMLLKCGEKGAAKEALLKTVWGVETELESHTLETHVYRLRAKLKDAGVTVTIAAAPGKYVLES